MAPYDGQAVGFGGRIVGCALGLTPAILYVTVMLRWLGKRGTRKLQRAA